jgi:hypothetical protein
MKRLALAALVALMPLAGLCQESMLYASPVQPAPANQGLRLYAREFPTSEPGVMKADVQIAIVKWQDSSPVPTRNIQKLRILDADGRPIEFTDRNPDSIPFESSLSGNTTYVATYALVDPYQVHRLGDVRFEYLGKSMVFNMRSFGQDFQPAWLPVSNSHNGSCVEPERTDRRPVAGNRRA